MRRPADRCVRARNRRREVGRRRGRVVERPGVDPGVGADGCGREWLSGRLAAFGAGPVSNQHLHVSPVGPTGCGLCAEAHDHTTTGRRLAAGEHARASVALAAHVPHPPVEMPAVREAHHLLIKEPICGAHTSPESVSRLVLNINHHQNPYHKMINHY